MRAFARNRTDPRRAAVLEWLRANTPLDEAAIGRAELVASRTGQPVEQVLNQLGSLTDLELAKAYCVVAGCDPWDPSQTPAILEIRSLDVAPDYLRQNRILPLQYDDDTLLCAVCDPLDDEALAGLAFATGGQIRILAAQVGYWRSAIDRALVSSDLKPAAVDEQRLARELDQVADLGDEGDGSRLVANAFEAGIAHGASDIHFEPRRNDFRIRLRVDGRLVEHRTVAADFAAPAVSRVKVIAGLDLGEHRLPQDGRTTFVVAGRQIDVRVATAPTVFGESAVLRILDRASVPLDIEALGFRQKEVDLFRRAASAPHGLFLVTGPTGSGKTTTLYALLQTFAGSPRKVLSVEDPVEYHFEHVAQTQVQPGIGLTFAAALRAFLRQDPDVILVGEIRDPETASIAIQAAMTGHLVLASVHANDALSVAPRLLDLGIEPFQLAAGLRGAAAQRLVRRLCPNCRESAPPSEQEISLFRALGGQGELVRAWRGGGCDQCNGEGYRGRVAIGEGFLADATMLRRIAEGSSLEVLERQAAALGFERMAADGIEKALEGVTTLSEVMAAVHA